MRGRQRQYLFDPLGESLSRKRLENSLQLLLYGGGRDDAEALLDTGGEDLDQLRAGTPHRDGDAGRYRRDRLLLGSDTSCLGSNHTEQLF